MALDKKDVRTWLSPEAHAVLQALADLHQQSEGQFASQVLEEALLGKVHAARVFVDRVVRFGQSRKIPEIPGIPHKSGSRRGE